MKLFRKAILVIHGFCGGLVDNEFLINQLETHANYDVYAWTLPYHEKKIMLGVKYTDWVEAVEHQVEFLLQHGYRSIYVIGHSMGGVLACHLATKYPQIKKLVLLSPAFDYLSYEQYREDFSHFWRLWHDSSVAYHRALWKAIQAPIPVVVQFQKLVRTYRPILKEVTIPCLVLFGDKDEVVPYSTLAYVKKNIGSKKVDVVTIRGGRHVLVRGSKQEEVISYIEAYFKGGYQWKHKRKKEPSSNL